MTRAVWLALTSAFLLAAAPDDALLQRAREASWNERWDESLAAYRTLVAASPDDIELRHEMARVLLWADRPAEAAPELERVVAARPLSAEARLDLARALQYSGRLDPAADHYALALAGAENDPALLAEGANVMRWAGRTETAQAWLSLGLARFPDHPDLRTAQAGAWFDAGHVERAEATVRAVLDAHPEHAAAREQLALIESEHADLVARARRLSYAQRWREARSLLEERLDAAHDDAEARLLLARIEAWSGRYPEAQENYRALLETNPRDRVLRTDYAEATSWRGDYTDARRMLGELAAEDPRDHRVRLDLANVDLWSGYHRGADAGLRSILAENPVHEGARAQLGHLNQLRAPAVTPRFSWFRDSDGFTLWGPESEVVWSPEPGRFFRVSLDNAQIRGYEPETHADGSFGLRERELRGFGFRAGWNERPDRDYEWSAELGAATWTGGGASPRAALGATWYPYDRHSLLLEGRIGEAVLDVRSIPAARAGIEQGLLQLVHTWNGERFNAWSQLAGGAFTDGRFYGLATTVLGARVLRVPSVDVLFHGTAQHFDRPSPRYYSPQELLAYAGGLRVQHRFFDQVDLRVTVEMGKLHSRDGSGDTLRVAPELIWDISERLRLDLHYDHFDSIRTGTYTSDYIGASLRWRFPVERPARP
jgi:predicted Zn-dependent protease